MFSSPIPPNFLAAQLLPTFSTPSKHRAHTVSRNHFSSHSLTANSLDTRRRGAACITSRPSPILGTCLFLRPVTIHKSSVHLERSRKFTSSSPISFRIKSFAQIHPYLPSNHILTNSFAPSKTLSPIVSYRSALFTQNTRGGVGAFQLLTTHHPLLTFSTLKPLPPTAHPYTCTPQKGPAAREPRYSPCAAC
jgi:hypothetical protein